MIRRFTLLAVLAALLSTAPGCAYFRSNPKLVSQSKVEQADTDLPIPLGFTMDTSDSFRHKRSDFRRFRLVYRQEGYLGYDRVVEFMKEQYPAAGWVMQFMYGLETTKFIFNKGADECRVEVIEDFGDAFVEFRVEVEARKTPSGDLVARSATTSLAASTPK